MSDIFSAAGLFFAVVGLFYSAWYSEIRDALNLKKATHKADRNPEIRNIEATQRSKAIPIALLTSVFAIILIPDFFKVIIFSWKLFSDEGVVAVQSYSSVRTLFCIIVLSTSALSVHAWLRVFRLHSKLVEFKT